MSPVERIINTLLLNASFIDNIGLLNGKMGISIAFYHLARQTGNKIYEDYAGELIDEIYEEITVNMPCDFENGLSGIGWGIEYLVQNGFIEADTDEVLSEFDEKLLHELTFHRPEGTELVGFLLSLGAYYLMRLKGRAGENPIWQKNSQTLAMVFDLLEQNEPQTTNHKLLAFYFMSEVPRHEFYTGKAENILNRFLALVAVKNPEVLELWFRLAVFLALATLRFKGKGKISRELYESIEESYNRFENYVLPEAIENWPEAKNFTMYCGTSGVSLLYWLIFKVTGREEYQQKAWQWQEMTLKLQSETKSVFAGYLHVEDENTGFGLLRGIASVLLAQYVIEYSGILEKQKA